MGSISQINKRLIKLFSYINKDGKVSDINTYYGQKWSDIKTDNEALNSIFKSIDTNGDGVVQAEELNTLNKILNHFDKMFNKNEVLDPEELNALKKEVYNGTLDINKISNENSTTLKKPWSEGLDRNITKIKLSSHYYNKKIINKMKAIGEEQGFSVEILNNGLNSTPWIEDSSIRRADGKIYLPLQSSPNKFKPLPVRLTLKSERGNLNNTDNGSIAENGGAFDVKVPSENKYYGTSYLEGGNVLNTCLKDGSAGAVVGEGSIATTLAFMNLEQTPENIELAKKQIATDLGLDKEKVTFIPQHEFHIDMIYRPLHNGQFAIPDYESGINILQNLLDDTNKQLTEKQNTLSNTTNQTTQSQQTQQTNSNKEILDLKKKVLKLTNKIKKLKEVNENSKSIREEANDYLKESGYKLVKMPCFTSESSDLTNFMNGVGGTSKKTGQTFYITNQSEFPELEKEIEKSLMKAGIDKVYFVSSQEALDYKGGIDCLTQEE